MTRKDLPKGFNIIMDRHDDGLTIIGIYKGEFCPINRRSGYIKTSEISEMEKDVLNDFKKLMDNGDLISVI